MLEASRNAPAEFENHARTLFAAMKSGGTVGFERVEWFNGGLFNDDTVMPLEQSDIEGLLTAAKLFWDEIDPSILGTLFEHGLDPEKRTELGAHYTDRDKIMMIVRPLVIEPLEAEWTEARTRITALIENVPVQTKDKLLRGSALAARTKAFNDATIIHRKFLQRIQGFRVLDPACGSGNFLNISLLALKDIEHRANLEAEQLGLAREFPRIGPENVLGIEVNSYAAELARVSVWIGEIQWMRRNGFDAARNPILRSLTNIKNEDALLVEDGSRAEWPKANVIIGNPPFLGSRKLNAELGAEKVKTLRRAYKTSVPNGSDLVCFWFAKAWEALTRDRATHVGLIATSSISGGASRRVLEPIADAHALSSVWRDLPWVVDGAAVEVSLICFGKSAAQAPMLNGQSVSAIYADLHAAGEERGNLVSARRLTENAGVAFQGVVPRGSLGSKVAKRLGIAPASFVMPTAVAKKMFELPSNPNGLTNNKVVVPYLTGDDITKRHKGRFVVDFYEISERDAALFEAPFAYVQGVRAHRAKMMQSEALGAWWRHWRERADMRAAIAPLHRFIVTPRVAKHRIFAWRKAPALIDNALVVIAREDDFTFGLLQSRHHRIWSLRMGTRLENRPRYTPTTTFATFPFPEGMTPDQPFDAYKNDQRAIDVAEAAKELNRLRENWLNPREITIAVKPFEHLEAQLEPVDASAAAVLKKRTLTKLYNAPPPWLQDAHAELDKAVSAAYGWSTNATDDQLLKLLLTENLRRSADEAATDSMDRDDDVINDLELDE